MQTSLSRGIRAPIRRVSKLMRYWLTAPSNSSFCAASSTISSSRAAGVSGSSFGGLASLGAASDQQIQQRVARHQNIEILDKLMLAAEAQQALHIQGKACVTLLRGQGS